MALAMELIPGLHIALNAALGQSLVGQEEFVARRVLVGKRIPNRQRFRCGAAVLGWRELLSQASQTRGASLRKGVPIARYSGQVQTRVSTFTRANRSVGPRALRSLG